MAEKPLFFLIAGEASGDLLGARLMSALKKQTKGNVRFAGVGGERMRAEGMDILFSQSELAHFGLFELIRHIPRLLQRMDQTVQAIRQTRPDALITIDAPDFCFRVAKRVKDENIPLIHYVAPTVWAWRAGRAKKIAKFLTHLMALLPFEPPYFTREGLPCTFVGHPIVESGAGKGDAAAFLQKYALSADTPIISLLPGSRLSEINRLMPVFKETVELLSQRFPGLVVVIPTLVSVSDVVRRATMGWQTKTIIVFGDCDKYDAFAASRAALACSGTVSVELAMANLPTIIAYKISMLTAILYRGFINFKFATLINIMRDKMIMPEYLQFDCRADKLANAVAELMTSEKAREAQKAELSAIAEWLGRGQFVPSEKAAEIVMAVTQEQQKIVSANLEGRDEQNHFANHPVA